MLELKSWPVFFQAIREGIKKHDLRDARDHHFFVGQELLLKEYDPFAGAYTGEVETVRVTYITSRETPCALSSAVLDKGYAILSLELV